MQLFCWQCHDIIQRMLTKLVGPFDTSHDRPISRENNYYGIYDDRGRRGSNWNEQTDSNIIGDIVIQATRRGLSEDDQYLLWRITYCCYVRQRVQTVRCMPHRIATYLELSTGRTRMDPRVGSVGSGRVTILPDKSDTWTTLN